VSTFRRDHPHDMDETLRNAPIGVVETASDGEITAVNAAAADLLCGTPDDLRGRDVVDALPRSAAGTLHAAFDDGRPTEGDAEEYYPRIERWLAAEVVGTGDGFVVYLRDRSRRHGDERTIDRLERRLDRLETIDSLVATVLRTVIDAADRSEVWHTVCDRLGTTDLYEFAWVGERDLADDRLRVVASAGDAPEMLDAIRDRLGADEGLPERDAVAADAPRVVQTIADDESIPRPVRVAAFGRGLQSCIAVPLVYGDTAYGVVGVYSARKDGFSDQERASLETLGAIAGFAVNAIRREDLLADDTVVELTLSVRDDSIPFVAASRRLDGELSLYGAVSRGDAVVCYVRADGATDAVAATLDDHDAVTDVRPVGGGDDPSHLEVGVASGAPVATLVDWGATVHTATYADGEARLVAQLPADADLRRAVDAVDGAFAGTDVVAKAERPRDPTTAGVFRDELGERLTDRQRTVLRTAYLADYFASPRGSTSEEVAEALDITGPTVLYHLRKAQRKLLDAFFDESPPDAADR
jgi:hypothetical protein